MVQRETLRSELERKRELERIPVVLPSGVEIKLSAGEHNVLQRDIVQKFLPRFGFGAEVMYLGDATERYLVRETERLSALGFFVLEHDELPDVIAYSETKNLLFLACYYKSRFTRASSSFILVLGCFILTDLLFSP